MVTNSPGIESFARSATRRDMTLTCKRRTAQHLLYPLHCGCLLGKLVLVTHTAVWGDVAYDACSQQGHRWASPHLQQPSEQAHSNMSSNRHPVLCSIQYRIDATLPVLLTHSQPHHAPRIASGTCTGHGNQVSTTASAAVRVPEQ